MYKAIKFIKEALKKAKISNSGSTLIEIPIVLAIVAGGMTLTTTTAAASVLEEARDVRRSSDAYQISVALAFYFDDNGVYPKYTGTDAKTSWSEIESALEPYYIQELPSDPEQDPARLYRYWSDQNIAKVFYTVESDESEKVRWSF